VFGKKFHEPPEEPLPKIVADFIEHLSSIHTGALVHCPFKTAIHKHCFRSMHAIYLGTIKGGVCYLLCIKCGFYRVGPQNLGYSDAKTGE